MIPSTDPYDEESFEQELIAMGKRNVASNRARMRQRVEGELGTGGPSAPSRQTSRLQLARLHDDYMALAREHDPDIGCVPFEVFALRVKRQRDHVRRVSGTNQLSVSVRLVEGRPKVIIKPH